MIHPAIVCAYLYVISKYGYPPPADRSEQYLVEMKALGFRSVELEGIRETHLIQMHAHKERLASTLDRLDLAVPYFCVVLPGLSSIDRHERERNLTLFRQGCEVASSLGARGVLDNAPLPPYAFPGDIPVVRHYHEDVLQAAPLPRELVWANYWGELIDTYRVACDIANEFGLTYQLHPCLGVLAATTDGFLYLRDAIGRENLRFNMDTANQWMMKDNLALCLHRLHDSIDYIHLSDNLGHRVEHLVPGRGSIEWDSFFDTLARVGFSGQIALDIGGAESDVGEIDVAYHEGLEWLAERWPLK